jgi:hypothetical protein
MQVSCAAHASSALQASTSSQQLASRQPLQSLAYPPLGSAHIAATGLTAALAVLSPEAGGGSGSLGAGWSDPEHESATIERVSGALAHSSRVTRDIDTTPNRCSTS